ncbi:MAG: MAPEG family protein [Pseudomonadota bacterium]
MSIELWAIIFQAVLLLAVTMWQGGLVPVTQGLKWGLGSRDEPREKSARQERFGRTVQNQMEAMLIFIPLMAVALYAGKAGELTSTASWCMIIGRSIFVASYIAGIFAVRSVGYAIGLIGIFATIWALFA